jgi:uncharacterized repeat protein (TIGR03803 family)
MLLLLLLLILPVLGAQGAVVFTTLHAFGVFTNGAYPAAALVLGSDGYFYGTAGGGTNGGNGTVFKISTNGALTTLYSFTGGNDGGNPQAALVQGSDGCFYGTTQQGGTNNVGTVFRISTNGAFTSLYSFTGGSDGSGPNGLVQGSDGHFYGTTAGNWLGGTSYGNVFKITTNGVLTSLYSFTGGNDGGAPNGLVQGSDGYFYGTTVGGGTNGFGTVFKISTNGALTTVYSFTGGSDASSPNGLVQGSDGNFYGTTDYGGTNNRGTVFKISPSGAYTSLYFFSGNDGAYPAAALVQGSDGYFYGTTAGTWEDHRFGNGTVFRISTNGALTSLYSFGGTNDGGNPVAGLVQGSDGNFYGTTENGGTPGVTWVGEGGEWGHGTVFKISPNGALTSLYSFPRSNDGWGPSGLVQASDGNFYGTTEQGGTTNVLNYNYPLGAGTVFKITTNGVLTSLYSFTGGNDGASPNGLVQGGNGSFYGTTVGGGTSSGGTVFKISTNGALTSLYSFIFMGNDGYYPSAALVQGSDGYFYGTTEGNGVMINNWGTVFKISTNGVLTSLYSFGGTNDGGFPQSALVQGSDGYFYGTTPAYGGGGYNSDGTVFKISANGALTSLHSFTGGYDGGGPSAGLVQGSDGNFYGTTSGCYAGMALNGTVFKMSTNGALTTLYSFTGGNDGANPYAGLVQGSDGSFYGTTYFGGTYGNGTVFKISTNGVLTSLYSFSGGNDGANPYYAGLVQGSDGSFYGTTAGYGAVRAGTIFRLTIVPEPQLTIIPSGPYVILTWPTTYNEFSYAGYTLQSTTNLGSSAVWSTNSSPPVVIGGENVVINPISGRQQFYRLSQ